MDREITEGKHHWEANGKAFSCFVELISENKWAIKNGRFVVGRVERVGGSFFGIVRTLGLPHEESFHSPYRAIAYAFGGMSAMPPLFGSDGKRSMFSMEVL